jgi:hypothetical protein
MHLAYVTLFRRVFEKEKGSVPSIDTIFRVIEARTVSHQAEAWTPTCGQAVRVPKIFSGNKKARREAVFIPAQ